MYVLRTSATLWNLRTSVTHRSRPTQRPRKDAVAQCEVLVKEMDMLDVARELAAQGDNVAVLNMAAPRSPGGGFRSGRGAQEENMHR